MQKYFNESSRFYYPCPIASSHFVFINVYILLVHKHVHCNYRCVSPVIDALLLYFIVLR